MRKTWGVRGISNPPPGGKVPAGRVGNVPILSKLFVRLRIKGAEKAITKLENKIENSVSKQRQKVDSIVAAAKKTDSASLIDAAHRLQDRLEEAACVEPDFREDHDSGGGREPAMTKAEKAQLRMECIKAANAATGLNWKSGTGHGGDPKYPIWSAAIDKCRGEKGV